MQGLKSDGRDFVYTSSEIENINENVMEIVE